MHKNLPKFNDSSYAHFVTTKTYENRPYFKNKIYADILLEELDFYQRRYGFILTGYVIMPDHLHLLLWWDKEETPDLNISKIMQGIKGVTAKRIIDLMQGSGLEHPLQSTLRNADGKSKRQDLQTGLRGADSNSNRRNLKYRLWQQGFYDFDIYTEEKLIEKLDYIHGNPVKAGLVLSPRDYEWSSCKEYFEEETALFGKTLREEHVQAI